MIIKSNRFWKLLLGAYVFVTACDSDGDAERLSALVVIASEDFTSLQIDEAATTISIFESEVITVSALNENGVSVPLDNASWSSSDTNLATVNSSGIVTAGSLDGEAVITASFGSLSASRPIRVSSAPLSEIEVLFNASNVGPFEVDECGAAQLQASGIYLGEEAEPRTITDKVSWSRTGTSGAFDANIPGLFRTQANGIIAVSAALTPATGAENAMRVIGLQEISVRNNLAGITIVPDEGLLDGDNALQYRALATYDDGTTDAEITDNVTWELNDNDAATPFAVVDQTLPGLGLVTASRAGGGVLSAACAGVTATLNIRSGFAGEADNVVIAGGPTLLVTWEGVEITQQLTANALLDGREVANVTELSDWTVTSTDSNISLSDDGGSKGELTIRGTGEIVAVATFTNSEGDEITSSPVTVTSRR